MFTQAELRKAVFRFAYLADHRAELIGMHRLVTSPIAKTAWVHIAGKTPRADESFLRVAADIGRNTLAARRRPHHRWTGAEGAAVAREAETSAKTLARLIIAHGNLRFPPEDIFTDEQRRALNSVVDDPSAADYRRIRFGMMWNDLALAEWLLRFAELARTRGVSQIVVSNPRGPLAEPRLFADYTCAVLDYVYGAPMIEAVCALTEAAFALTTLDAGTVKKWWQRDRDKLRAQSDETVPDK